jgi:hypothetical protein
MKRIAITVNEVAFDPQGFDCFHGTREGRMKTQIFLKALLLALIVLLTGAYVYAGDPTVTIKQPFKAGGKEYPEGRYRILADDESDHIDLLNPDGKTNNEIRFITRLSERKGEWGEVVFDKVGNDLCLTEIYIVGMDGFFFQGAPGKHKHLVIKEDVLK